VGRGLSWQQVAVLKQLAEAETKDGQGAGLSIVELSERLYSYAYDLVADRDRASRDIYASARRSIFALERRGLVQIGRPRFDVFQEATSLMTVATVYLRPRRRQPWIKGASKRLLSARITPEGRAYLDGADRGG